MTINLDALRARYRALAEACDLPLAEFTRRCRGVMCVNTKYTDMRNPEHWLGAGEIVAKSIRFANWPRGLPWPCCASAEIFSCVCTVAVVCPTHREEHYGEHGN